MTSTVPKITGRLIFNFIIALILIFLIVPAPIAAQAPPIEPKNSNLDLLNAFTGGRNNPDKIKNLYRSPAGLVNLIVRNLFVLAGLLLFVNMLWAGFKFIHSGAKGKDEAKSIFTVSIVGFILMFTAYWLVQIISLITGTNLI